MADPAAPKPPAKAGPTNGQPASASGTPAAPAAEANLSTRRAQTLRQAQVKRIPTSRLKPIGHFSDPQQAMLPAGWDFTDALEPEFWALIAPGLQANVAASVMHDRLGTIFHIHSDDNAFYGQVVVTALRRNKEGTADAALVTCIGPAWDAENNRAWAVDVKTGGVWKGRPAKAEAA
jgi:hypothetical protein